MESAAELEGPGGEGKDEPLHSEAVRTIIDVQVEQLQASLTETSAIATQAGAGVLVVWSDAKDISGQMKVEMFVDGSVAVGDVKIVHAEPT